MPFTLPNLPYAADALEKAIDKTTMEIHHGRHHKTYVDNLNKALEGHADLRSSRSRSCMRNLNSVPEAVRTAVRQQRRRPRQPHDVLGDHGARTAAANRPARSAEAIKSTFGGFDAFKAKIKENALGQFGSGWSWLVVGADGKLQALKTANQDTPLMDGQTPLLGRRRLGARLLPEVPEQAGRLRRCLVERRELAGDAAAVR